MELSENTRKLFTKLLIDEISKEKKPVEEPVAPVKKEKKVKFVKASGESVSEPPKIEETVAVKKERKPNAWAQFLKQYKEEHGWGEGAMQKARELYAASKEKK